MSESYRESLDLARFGDWEASAALLRTLLSETPDDYQICLALSCVLVHTERPELASVYLALATRLNPAEARLLSDRGDVFSTIGQFSEAVSAYEQALVTVPGLSEQYLSNVYINLGAAAWKIGDLDETLRSYREAARRRPQNAEFQYWFGWILGKVADRGGAHHLYREAAEIFQHVLVLEPQNGMACEALGVALCRQKEWLPAVEAFREAARLRPEDIMLKFGLGAALGNAADKDQAESLYREAAGIYRQIILREPDSGTAHEGLGVALASLGEFVPAIKAFRERLCRNQGNCAKLQE